MSNENVREFLLKTPVEIIGFFFLPYCLPEDARKAVLSLEGIMDISVPYIGNPEIRLGNTLILPVGKEEKHLLYPSANKFRRENLEEVCLNYALYFNHIRKLFCEEKYKELIEFIDESGRFSFQFPDSVREIKAMLQD
jgi:hypothetical protein